MSLIVLTNVLVWRLQEALIATADAQIALFLSRLPISSVSRALVLIHVVYVFKLFLDLT